MEAHHHSRLAVPPIGLTPASVHGRRPNGRESFRLARHARGYRYSIASGFGKRKITCRLASRENGRHLIVAEPALQVAKKLRWVNVCTTRGWQEVSAQRAEKGGHGAFRVSHGALVTWKLRDISLRINFDFNTIAKAGQGNREAQIGFRPAACT